ncbi:ATP-binding protein [Streptomyces sp. NBC_01483]|uniref:ATP-binding protein n=1 Tax=Streptomyces sp. NBC_01483 TaxID=2903883 RepID=UPI002E32DF11|nr:AAA family ATPase [Streptomyces sp. NBC_01483]
MGLFGRTRECALIDGVLADVRAGRSRTLVLRGRAGAGKTALLDYATEAAEGLRVVRITGIESEMELAYAGVQQLVARNLDEAQLSELPAPQRGALEAVLGLRASASTGRMLVGLAVLTRLSNAGATTPLVCVVDDAQWLDRESAEVLAFVARRTHHDAFGLLFAVRETERGGERLPFEGLEELLVEGLAPAAACELMAAVASGPTDENVRDRIVAETGGNPLALRQITAGLSPGQLSGRLALPEALPLGTRLEQALLGVVRGLPEPTQTVLLVAAADPTGDESLVRRTCAALGTGFEAIGPAEAQGLVDLTEGIAFRHPLLRAAVLSGATSAQRQAVHQALAEATDPVMDPDRRAWHRAFAVPGPDENVAAELEASADRARRRGGLAAAGVFLQRAGDLSTEPGPRTARYLAAAEAHIAAGSLNAGSDLITLAEQQPRRNAFHDSQCLLLRGMIASARGRGNDAAPLLTAAARALEPLDQPRAVWAHLLALQGYLTSGHNAPADAFIEAVRAAGASPRSQPPTGIELLLDGFVAQITDSHKAAVPVFRQAFAALDTEDAGPVLEMAVYAAAELWDDSSHDRMSDRYVRSTRALGGLAMLPLALSARAESEILSGRYADAQALCEEMREIAQTTGGPGIIGAVLPAEGMVAALHGDQERARELAAAVNGYAIENRLGMLADVASHSLGILEIGYGRHAEAVRHLRFALTTPYFFVSTRVLPDLAEAAARADEPELACRAADQLSLSTQASGTPLGLGVDARTRALVADDALAEDLYVSALGHLRQTRAVLQMARTHQLYGEWLRRRRRRREAREQLRTAYEMFSSLGTRGFAERARAELEATGEHARQRTSDVAAEALTPQEARIARLAAEGASNPEIAEQLYVSRRTVESHLTKIYAKLGVNSRTQLAYIMLRAD